MRLPQVLILYFRFDTRLEQRLDRQQPEKNWTRELSTER